jgi:hypothetical protein
VESFPSGSLVKFGSQMAEKTLRRKSIDAVRKHALKHALAQVDDTR